MAHRNRWFTVLNSMVIFHGKLLVITRGYVLNQLCVAPTMATHTPSIMVDPKSSPPHVLPRISAKCQRNCCFDPWKPKKTWSTNVPGRAPAKIKKKFRCSTNWEEKGGSESPNGNWGNCQIQTNPSCSRWWNRLSVAWRRLWVFGYWSTWTW